MNLASLHGIIASIALTWAMMVTGGCTPRVRVISHPGARDPGIRFYRPKPYLLLTPATVSAGTARNAATTTVSHGELVAMELKYLPDFAEEYALDVRTGLGSAKVSVELEDGWNLVSLNQDLDSKVDKNVAAVADLLKALPSIGSRDAEELGDKRFYVHASNVPLGFYEAVLGTDGCGIKRLYGFRYIGFLPFAPCPICPRGTASACCDDGTSPLYGLVFEEGVMVFRPMGYIAGNEAPASRIPVQVGGISSSRTVTTTTTEQDGQMSKKVEVTEIERLPAS